MYRIATSLGLVLLLLATAVAKADSAPSTRGQIEALVNQLGDPSPAHREAASNRLERLGIVAELQLRTAAAHPTLEIRRRAERLLMVLENSPDYRRAVGKQLAIFVETFVRADLTGLALPGWESYCELVGDSRLTRQFFAQNQLATMPTPAMLWAHRNLRDINATGNSNHFLQTLLVQWFGITFVSDMHWVSATSGGDSKPRRDGNYHKSSLFIDGKPYPKGIWTHTFPNTRPADIEVDIQGQGFGWFVSDIGVDDSAAGGSVQFQVWVDGKMKAESTVLSAGNTGHFQVDVTGASRIRLRVLNGGDGNFSDHAVWGWAHFVPAQPTQK